MKKAFSALVLIAALVAQGTTAAAQAGIDWVSQSSSFDLAWASVAYGNGLFVAVAVNGTGKRVMTSPDGINWTSRASAADNSWSSVTYGNGLFVAVSESGTGNRVMTSPDGITWTSRTSAADNSWKSITFGNGIFVAVSFNGTGNRVMTSPDGITWTSRTSAADNGWLSVTYGNGLFVAVSTGPGTGNRVMTSPDGITWTSRASAADNQWLSVTYGNSTFVAVSSNGTGNRVMTSSDGITWTSSNAAAANQWWSVTYGNGLFVAVSYDGGGNRVMTSPDGITWTSRASAANNQWQSVTYGNGLFLAVTTDPYTGKHVMTSPDGITWTSVTLLHNHQWRSVAYGNGLFVAVSNSGTGYRVMTSPDGIIWTARTSTADNEWSSVTYGNGLFVAVAAAGTNRVMTSPDGITWTPRTSIDNQWQSVGFGNGLFVAVANGGGNRVMTSPDGITWTSRVSAADNYWISVTYGNGLFVAVSITGTGNRVMTSPDGISWTSRTSTEDNAWYSVTYGNGLFVAVSAIGAGNRVMTSPDGITWTSRNAAVNNQWVSVTYGNGLFVAVGNSGTGNRVMTSPDGITWTSRASAADNNWQSVCYANGLFVAVSYDGIGNRVMTSGTLVFTWYADADGDGFGDPLVSQLAATAPANYVSNGNDCDDTDAGINHITVQNLTGGGCAGTSVTLDNSETGVTYRLKRNGFIMPGVTVAGTGSSVSLGPLTAPGVYTVYGTGTNGGCITDMAGSATITPANITAQLTKINNTSCGTNGTVTLQNVTGFTALSEANFDAGLPDGFTITGNAAVDANRVQLTSANNSEAGTLVFTPSLVRPDAFTATFDLTITKDLVDNSAQVADGASFNYGYIALPTGNNYENGITNNGLVIRFLEFGTQRIEVWFAGVQLGSTVYTNIVGRDNACVVSVSQEGLLSLRVNETTIVNLLVANWESTLKGNWSFGWAARTGGSNSLHAVDNVNIYNNNRIQFTADDWATSRAMPHFSLPAGSYTIKAGTSGCSSTVSTTTIGLEYQSQVYSDGECGNRTIDLTAMAASSTLIEARFASRPTLANFGDLGDAVFTDGSVELTSASNSKNGRIIFPTTPNTAIFTANFRARVWEGNGADGYAFNFGAINNASGAEQGMFNTGTPGLTVGFATYGTQKVIVKYKNVVLLEVPFTIRNSNWIPMLVQVTSDHRLIVRVNGSAVVWLYDLAANSTYATDNHSNWQFGFGARTGGANDRHQLDDIVITGNSGFTYSFDGGATFGATRSLTTPNTGAISCVIKPDGGCSTQTTVLEAESTETAWYADDDDDGYGDPNFEYLLCSTPLNASLVQNNLDCDDTDELSGALTTWYEDADGDGYGNQAVSTVECIQPANSVADNTDCDDDNNLVGPCKNWTGASSTLWNVSGNWNPSGVPGIMDEVFIPALPSNQPHVTNLPASPAVTGTVNIQSGAVLTVEAGKALTISGDLNNEGTILVEADAAGIGSLITEGTIAGAGTFQAEQYLLGAGGATPNGVFQYVSSPAVGATSASYGAAGTNKLWSANEATQAYTEITDNITALNAGQGYVARMGANGVVTLAGSTFNTGTMNINSLTRTGSLATNRGYNLIGNPYPSSVSWDAATKTNLETTMWYRTHTAGNAMTVDTYNATGSIGTNNNFTGNDATGTIPPGQGFWVRVVDGETIGSVTFGNAMRSHGALASIYKMEAEEGTVRLKLSNGTMSDEAIVLFNSEAQDSYDDFDSQKLWASNIPQLYMNVAADTVTINGLASSESNPIVDLGMKLPLSGNYTLNANSITLTGETVHLEDRMLNIFQNLNEEPNYSFTSAAGNIGDRFALHFGMSVTGIGTDAINRVSSRVYSSNGNTLNIILSDQKETGRVEVMDMAGRIVQAINLNSTQTTVEMNVNAGVYLVRVETAEGTTTHKIILN